MGESGSRTGSPRQISQAICFDTKLAHADYVLSPYFPEKSKLLWTCSWGVILRATVVEGVKLRRYRDVLKSGI
jgi:hypothetical protein